MHKARSKETGGEGNGRQLVGAPGSAAKGAEGADMLGSFRTTMAGRMLDCNQALADLLGYGSVEELKRIPVKELYFDLGERQRFIKELKAKKQLSNFEILLKHKSGKPIHVQEIVHVVEDGEGSMVIEGVMVDITAVRRAEQEQRIIADNYRQLIERLHDGVLILQAGRTVFANAAAVALLAPDFRIGMAPRELVSTEDADQLTSLLENVSGKESKEGVRINFRSSGDPRPLMVHAGTSWYMGGPAVQITLQDVETQRTLMQERLRTRIAEEMNVKLRAEIAEHKRTQEALVKSRRLAKSLIDSSLDMIIGVDPKGNITEFNPAAAIKFGCEAEEMMGKSSRVLYADQAEFDRIQQEMTRFGAYAGEVRNIASDGKFFTSFLAASKLFDEEGELIGSMGVSRDVTQAKKDQEALRASEERYRDLVDNAHDLIHSVDLEGRILFTNRAWKTTLGYSDEDLAGITMYDLLEPAKRDAARHWLNEAAERMDQNIWRAVFITKDGRKLLMEGTATARKENGRTVAVRSIFRDITAVQEAQDKLLKHAEKEKALFQASDHMFWTVDRRIALTSFNQGYKEMVERMHGTSPEINTDEKKPRALFAPKDYHDFWETKYKLAFAGNTVRFETDRLDKFGKRVCNEIYLSPVRDGEGNVVEVFGIGHEVTAEREAEAKAREHAAKLNAIFDSSAEVMIWVLDRENNLVACNKQFTQMIERGYGKRFQPGDNIRMGMMGMVPGQLDAELLAVRERAFKGEPQHHEAGILLPNGSTMWVDFFISPIITDGEIKEISCLAYDITDKKKYEETLLENLREKEVLLKEVHHRVKNNLQIISSIFNLQRDHVDDDPLAMTLLQESRNRIFSMSFIHESLYQNEDFSQVDLGQYIDGLCRNLLLSYSLSGKVHLQTELQHIMLDLDRAIPCGLILNELISNALKHAFPNGKEGTITIGLKEEKGMIMISVKDDGAGFPSDFNQGKDGGLGMELVEMLTDQLDGRVDRTRSEGASGTAYLITFERSRN
jgi:PAS domain S-box-containing protein